MNFNVLDIFAAKFKECKSFALSMLFPFADLVVNVTLLSSFRLFGISRDKILIPHAEAYLWATTFTLIALTVGPFYWLPAGWVMIVIGSIRLLQILSLDFLFIYFDFRLFAKIGA